MTEAETKKKKRKKQLTALVEQQEEESQNVAELTQVLEDLEKQKQRVDIQVCPKCKSAKVRRAKVMSGDLWGHMGLVQPKYECLKCGWQTRLVLKATNKPMTVKEVELIAEARDLENEESK
jgi:transposase-like protein